jgi:hypothetical protein
MKCELIDCRSDGMDDWWTIERLEHDGREWMAPIPGSPGSMQFMVSARPSDACIEGYAEEMLAMEEAQELALDIRTKLAAA